MHVNHRPSGIRVFNIPNTLTISRIVLIPLFITAVLYGKHTYALYIFVLAAITDILDGLLARLTDQKTELGMFLDPLADKFLLVSSFILFTINGWIPVWLTITVISRDIIVVCGWVLLSMLTRHSTVEPVLLGKTAIALQLIMLSYVLFGVTMKNLPPLPEIFFYITAFVTALSGLQYMYKGFTIAHVHSARHRD